MAEDRKSKEKQRLRQYLNPAIRGPNTDAVLEALASGPTHLIENVEAVTDQLYIATASGQYLDQLLAGRNITRPDNVGLSDEIFRELGIQVSNRKQVRDLIHEILRTMYGDEFVRATTRSAEFEPYVLEDGDTLIVSFDNKEPVEVTFVASQFSSIASASAQEVADAITKEIRRLGRSGSAIAKDDGIGGYVTIISESNGPASSVQVLGGKAQNKLKFDEIRPTSGLADTQWVLSQQSGGIIRATWTGGPNPKIGKVESGDYVNIYGTPFESINRGTFTVVNVQGGSVNEAYVEFLNPAGVPQGGCTIDPANNTTQALCVAAGGSWSYVLQGSEEGMLFFNPVKKTINSKVNYAAAYQTESRLLEVFIPATTKVIRRERQGAAHLHESGASAIDQLGPYTFDTTKGFIIGGEECNTLQKIDANSSLILEVDDATDIPDSQGFLIFGFGTSKEEGPVPYISRPSSSTLLINPSYNFQNVHEAGTNISLVASNSIYDVANDGSDYPFYVTDIVAGRIYAEELINLVVATGIRVVVTILYPNDIGLAKWGTENSDRFYIWGADPE